MSHKQSYIKASLRKRPQHTNMIWLVANEGFSVNFSHLGHSIKLIFVFLGGSAEQTIKTHRRSEGWLDYVFTRKSLPALYLHFAPQHREQSDVSGVAS